jgi:hypothetical protein
MVMELNTVAYAGKRVSVESEHAFEQVRDAFHAVVPRTMPMEAYPSAMKKAGGLDRASFEIVVQSQLGPYGFMLFQEFDFSMWLPLYGVNRKAMRWILGNPLIAITMINHDLDAALFTPVELLLRERSSGGGSTIVYDLPSSLIAIRDNPPLLDAARVLDDKLDALVRRVAGHST